jgi:hypothetical protein
MGWSFELNGDASDKQALKSLASACDCTIRPGPDAKPWLGGTKFDGITTREEALATARRTLARLNGLARLENPQVRHRTVCLGNAFLQDQRMHFVEPSGRSRTLPGSEVYEYTSPLTGGPFVPPVDPPDDLRRKRIMDDPKLAEILEVVADETTWQKQRVAFEKINALVGKGDNALVKHRYAKQPELTRFKANAQDPRHSGHEAVHGVPRGPLEGTKMPEQEGMEFIARLLKTYIEKTPAAGTEKATGGRQLHPMTPSSTG